jgi:hypothetical protein
LEPVQPFPAGLEVRTKHLQGYLPLEGRVLGAVHLSHATLAELFENAEVREGLADHGSS